MPRCSKDSWVIALLGLFRFRHGGANGTRHPVHGGDTYPVLLRDGPLRHACIEISADPPVLKSLSRLLARGLARSGLMPLR
jgi:hypothetical protein